jgi:hypothetical protein
MRPSHSHRGRLPAWFERKSYSNPPIYDFASWETMPLCLRSCLSAAGTEFGVGLELGLERESPELYRDSSPD